MLMIGVNLQHSNLLFIPHSRRCGYSLTHSQNATCPMISNEVASSTCSRQTPFYHLSGPRFISHSLLSSSIISHSIEALSYRVVPPSHLCRCLEGVKKKRYSAGWKWKLRVLLTSCCSVAKRMMEQPLEMFLTCTEKQSGLHFPRGSKINLQGTFSLCSATFDLASICHNCR